MKYDVAILGEANAEAYSHLLQHYKRGIAQEDLCFALWYPSYGATRTTAIIHTIIIPNKNERILNGNVSFSPDYLARSIRLALQQGAGLAFMHSHPGNGWQDMSGPDIQAEQAAIAYPAGVTGLPLVGLTVGKDGYWSARFWIRESGRPYRIWCNKVRVAGRHSYRIWYNDSLVEIPARKKMLTRTFDSWGERCQQDMARMRVGVIGLGSVGMLVAESLARMGVEELLLIDPDRIEEHNLDRLLYSTTDDIGKYKVDVAQSAIERNATANDVKVTSYRTPIQNGTAYRAALDSDFLFSCVDRPIGRDILNHIAIAHLIPVIDGGVSIEKDLTNDRLRFAHWKAHYIAPYHQCLRCNGQYSSGDVVLERDGSLDDSSYIANLPIEKRQGNQNVFPFCLSVASMEINLMVRYIINEAWWPPVQQQDYQFVSGKIAVYNRQCHENCAVSPRTALGSTTAIPIDVYEETLQRPGVLHGLFRKLFRLH